MRMKSLWLVAVYVNGLFCMGAPTLEVLRFFMLSVLALWGAGRQVV